MITTGMAVWTKLTGTERVIYKFLRRNSGCSMPEIAEGTGIPLYLVKRGIGSIARKQSEASKAQH